MIQPELLSSPAALAYLGDSVLELLTRERLVRAGFHDAKRLNQGAMAFVTASAQSAAFGRIEPLLSEEETDWFRRGRNHTAPVPRSATVAEYRRATGMETLFAALYLTGRSERMRELFDAAYPPDAPSSETAPEQR